MISNIEHDILNHMGDVIVSEQEERYEQRGIVCNDTPSVSYELKRQYRYFRKKLLLTVKKYLKRHFINILYVTTATLPEKYITAFQKQYPDKVIQVLTPTLNKDDDKPFLNFEYTLQNQKYNAYLYKNHLSDSNIQIYSLYTEAFEKIIDKDEIYKIQYISHYSKCARIIINKLKVDIVHADNIPLFLGMEFCANKIYTKSVLQMFHHLPLYQDIEPFWAILNLLNKNGIKKLCKDKIIKKNIAALFGIKSFKGTIDLNKCLSYIYENYEKYRSSFGPLEKTNENILIERLNQRVLQLFPNMIPKGETLYKPEYYSIKRANASILNSKENNELNWIKYIPLKPTYLKPKEMIFSNDKVNYPFDISNFREFKIINKKYLIKEFSEKRIETKFTDINLYKDEVQIEGFLDIFYQRGALLLVPLASTKEDDIKTVVLAILKCFESKKNIQVIFNTPLNFHSPYLSSVIEFLNTKEMLAGKWIYIKGDLNVSQFAAASDMVLLPASEVINIEQTVYTALKYGCIPITTEEGICGEIVTDIFDDMTTGCGFKKAERLDETIDKFEAVLIKALNFFVHNSSSWNILIKNAMQYDSSWDFKTLEQYNNIYEEL